MKKHKFGWMDLAILVLVVALGVGTYYKFFVSSKTSTVETLSPITYTLRVASVRQGTVDAIQAGDKLYDNDSGNCIGVISAVDVSDAVVSVSMQDGTVVQGPSQNRYDLVLTVNAEGSVQNGASYVNKTYQLNVGSNRGLYTKYASFTGRISSIS